MQFRELREKVQTEQSWQNIVLLRFRNACRTAKRGAEENVKKKKEKTKDTKDTNKTLNITCHNEYVNSRVKA